MLTARYCRGIQILLTVSLQFFAQNILNATLCHSLWKVYRVTLAYILHNVRSCYNNIYLLVISEKRGAMELPFRTFVTYGSLLDEFSSDKGQWECFKEILVGFYSFRLGPVYVVHSWLIAM